MTFILMVIACLQATPESCVGERIDLPDVTTASSCHLVGALRLEEWEREHAEYLIKEANCMARPLAAAGGEF